MKSKKLLKRIFDFICMAVVILAIDLAVQIGMEGMWLFGIPKAEDVISVTIKYPSLVEESLMITDREQIETCVSLSGFLKYKPFINGDAKICFDCFGSSVLFYAQDLRKECKSVRGRPHQCF